MRQTTAATLVLLTSLGAARADAPLLWERRDAFGGGGGAYVATVAGGARVYLAGSGFRAGGGLDLVVQALDAGDGTLLWQDQPGPIVGSDTVRGLALHGDRLFAVGTVGPSTNSDMVVRGYDAETGAVRWADRIDGAGSADTGEAIAVHGDGVFAIGNVFAASTRRDMLVRAYEAETGALRWQDRIDSARQTDSGRGIAAAAGRVFAGGIAAFDYFVRGYDAATGAVLWEDRFDLAGGFDETISVVARGTTVMAAGSVTSAAGDRDWFVRAYDAVDGRILWSDRLDAVGRFDLTVDAAAAGNGFYAAGTIGDCDFFEASDCDWFVRAYDGRSGAVLWEDRFDRAASDDQAQGIGAADGVVVATGATTAADGTVDLTVRAYDATTGALRWSDLVSGQAGFALGNNVAVAGGRAFAAGYAFSFSGRQAVARAYQAR